MLAVYQKVAVRSRMDGEKSEIYKGLWERSGIVEGEFRGSALPGLPADHQYPGGISGAGAAMSVVHSVVHGTGAGAGGASAGHGGGCRSPADGSDTAATDQADRGAAANRCRAGHYQADCIAPGNAGSMVCPRCAIRRRAAGHFAWRTAGVVRRRRRLLRPCALARAVLPGRMDWLFLLDADGRGGAGCCRHYRQSQFDPQRRRQLELCRRRSRHADCKHHDLQHRRLIPRRNGPRVRGHDLARPDDRQWSTPLLRLRLTLWRPLPGQGFVPHHPALRLSAIPHVRHRHHGVEQSGN
jgi:hypothetical protein